MRIAVIKTPNYVTITITNFTPFECLSLIYNSEDNKTKIILILKTCLKMYIISHKMESILVIYIVIREDIFYEK
jgi:hypothetical protein